MDLKKKFKSHPHWPSVLSVLDTLTKAGYQAFLVGGSVRDALLKISVKDFDVSTDALPEQVESLFPRTVPIGREFGVIAVVCSPEVTVEVTTFRKESEYNSKRQPTRIEFTDLEGDASRRDFTINALYFDVLKNQMIDPFDGESDLRKRTLRAIGDAKERLEEDPLRILRAVRFHSRFDFSYDEELKSAIEQTRGKLSQVSKERVFDEFQKIFSFHSWRRALISLQQFKLWEPLHLFSPSTKEMEKVLVIQVDGGLLEVLAWLWRSLSEKEIGKNLVELKASNIFQRALLYFVREGRRLFKEDLRVGEIYQVFDKAPPGFLNYLQGLSEIEGLESKFKNLHQHFLSMQNLLVGGELPPPLVDGDELLRRGVKKGPELGALKNELYLRQLEGSFTSLEELDDQIKEFLRTSNEA